MEQRRSGDRRHLVRLERRTGRVPVGDGYVDTFTPYRDVWASIQPIAGTDRLIASTQQTPVTHIVRFDYVDELRNEDRIVHDGRTLYVRSWADDDERKWTAIAHCEERTT